MSAVDLHYEVSGPADAPVLLLGGSLGTSLAMWEPQVAALGAELRCVRFDHRGHGGSPVPDGPYTLDDLGADVLRLLDRLQIRRAAYAGVSLGGMVGQWLAINAPDRVAAIVCICTAAHLPPADPWHERAATVRAAGTPAVVAEAVVARWFTPGYADAHPDVLAAHEAMLSTQPADGYAGCCEAIAAMDLRPGLSRVRARTLVIAGAQDPAIPPAHGAAIADAVPGARLTVLDPAAHLCTVERADDVNDLIAGHLAGLEAS